MGQSARIPCGRFGLFLMFCMLGGLFTGGILLNVKPLPVAGDATPAIVLDDRVDQVLAPGVRIRFSTGPSGSGVMIGEDLVLTAAHLFFLHEESKDATITVDLFFYDPSGEILDRDSVEACPVKIGDPANDVALLRLKDKPRFAPAVAPLLPLGVDLRLFHEVYVVGCPKGIEPRPTRGEVSFIGDRFDARMVGATADIYFGNSGGALMVKLGDRWYVATVLSRMETSGPQALSWLAYYAHPDVVREFLAGAF